MDMAEHNDGDVNIYKLLYYIFSIRYGITLSSLAAITTIFGAAIDE